MVHVVRYCVDKEAILSKPQVPDKNFRPVQKAVQMIKSHRTQDDIAQH